MAKLALHLLKHGLDRAVANAAVVTIRQIADAEGRFPESPFEQAVPIPAGPVRPLIVEVPEGRFTLTARMPSGATDQKTMHAYDGEIRTITFDTGHSAREWLSWQTLSGSVPPVSSFDRRGDRPARSSENTRRPRPSTTTGLSAFTSSVSLPPRNPRFPDSVDVLLARGRLTFQSMSIMAAGPGLNLKLRRSGDAPSAEAWQIDANGHHLRWGAEGELHRPLAIVRSADVRTVALLPLPWMYKLPDALAWNATSAMRRKAHFAPVDLLFDRAVEARRATRMMLREPEFVALLSYLGAGRLSEAVAALGGPSLDAHVTRLISDKIHNPLAAAGAAYVGLATSGDNAARRHWGPWLRNLMNWFPDLPDGAVIFARDRIDRGRSPTSLIQAKRAFKKAYRRGVPLYVAGLQHLLNGLQLFSDPEAGDLFDAEAARMRDQVAAVSTLVDATQPFTVLTLPS